MARPADDLSRLLTLLRTLGDDDFVALASRGLVRRARKALADAEPRGWIDDQAEVVVGEHTVRIPAAGPVAATCSCPSPGACQHIVAACWALVEAEAEAVEAAEADRSSGEPSTSIDATAAEPDPHAWSSIALDRLKRWAGAGAWRQAVALADTAEILPSDAGAPIVVRFPDETETRLSHGGHLDSLITSAPPRRRRRAVAAAVLAVRAGDDGWLVAAETTVAVTLPIELLDTLHGQITECVRLGLHHLTASTLARFETLTVQCRAAGLYRAGHALASCASEVRRIRARDAHADPERLFDRLTRLYALVSALQASPIDPDPVLVGTARRHYRERGTALHLTGCGAYPWRTPSGHHGLTAVFWDAQAAHFVRWTDSRPVGGGDGFDPRARYEEDGPWPKSGRLDRLCRSCFVLHRPRLDEHRGLSASSSSSLGAVTDARRDALPPAERSWSALRSRFDSLPSLGLKRPAPLDFMVRVEPTRFHPARFDEIEQTLVWPLEDAEGERLSVVLPFAPENAHAMQYIEHHRWQAGESILARYQPIPDEGLFPIARFAATEPPEIDSLAFAEWHTPEGGAEAEAASGGWFERLMERRQSVLSRAAIPPDRPADVLPADDARRLDDELTPLRQLLAPVRERLLQTAESGLATANPDPVAWKPLADQVGGAGLVALAGSLTEAPRSADALLRAAYTLSLYWQAR